MKKLQKIKVGKQKNCQPMLIETANTCISLRSKTYADKVAAAGFTASRGNETP